MSQPGGMGLVDMNDYTVQTTDMSGFPQVGTEVIDQAKIEPVIAQQDAIDYMADPLLRQLYFGSEDTPGFLSQVQKATQRSLGQDVPVQQFADLSEAEQRALDSAVSGIGGFQPFLDETQKSIQDAIAREQQAGAIMDPYFQQAETQLGSGLSGLLSSFGQMGPSARDFQRASLTGFDPRSAQAFFNPFEEQVVQRTIDDVLRAGEMRDIEQRAADIKTGGESAFGSRARLTAADRQRALGRGLGEALAGIRSGGFSDAMRQAQAESQFQRGGLERAASFEAGLGRDVSGARRTLASDLLGLGGRKTDLSRDITRSLVGLGKDFGALGREQQALGRLERSELMNLGGQQRRIAQDRLSAQFKQQQDALDRPLKVLGAAGALLPKFTGGFQRVDTQYRLPRDPVAGGLAAGLGAYTSFKNPYQQQQQPQG
jgi:hypothetical protein